MVFLELCLDSQITTGTQGTPRVAAVKSNIHSSCVGELGIALETLQVK